ncbi:phosphosulfolactate synthase [Methylocystis echinoides]|uniref:Phosphosulfolactate synthase n=1 Tax=Methylocystis echinoides TaxID=29468 RepID=A0A9W6GU21_9HYPH|nr:phosphosulfolactate synthase [Methylocystis echinoides]GLI93062.1 phosphosulfolactate synthase [Methylocystis echinoides]
MSDPKSGWRGVWTLDAMVDRRIRRPRATGVTMVIDTGIGLSAMADILELSGDHIDQWKFGFGTTALMPRAALEAKLALLRARDILAYPGGTLLEAAVVQEHCRVFMQRAAELGFSAVEISEGTIDLPAERRRRMIDCARNAGLTPITEVGRKDPKRQPDAEELAQQTLRDLDWGAAFVIIEGRESGRNVGIYDRSGDIREPFLEDIVRLVGDAATRLIWEAPERAQQACLICRFGANVSLGNIAPHDCLALEALRCGLRFETFQALAQNLQDAGMWDPTRIEGGVEHGLAGRAK